MGTIFSSLLYPHLSLTSAVLGEHDGGKMHSLRRTLDKWFFPICGINKGGSGCGLWIWQL